MDEKQEKKRRVPRKLIVAAVIVLVLAGGFAAWRVHCSALVREQLEAIQAAGYAVTLEELDARYPVPVENTADVYWQAFDNYVEASEEEGALLPIVGEAALPPLGTPMPEEMRRPVEQYVAANREALDLLHKAGQMKECRFAGDLTMGADLLLPHLEKLRQGARMLSAEALMYAERGDGARAMASVRSSLAIGRFLSGEPTMLDLLVHVAADAITIDALERVMSLIPIPEEDAVNLQDALAGNEVPDQLARCLAGEIFFQHWFFTRPLSERASGLGIARPYVLLLDATGLSDIDFATCLGLMREIVGVAEKPHPDRLRAMRAFDLDNRIESLPNSYMMTRRLMPTCVRATEEDAKDAARLRAARVALAVERYRRTRGPLPETLSDLVPDFLDAVPQDPFDGEPLRYKRLEVGYVVYSVGPNEADDGGNGRMVEGEDYDVTFTVAR